MVSYSHLYLRGSLPCHQQIVREAVVRYFVRNTPFLLLMEAISNGSALLLTYVFAHYTTQEVYGQYRYVISILGVAAILSLPGVNTAIAQAAARSFEGVLWEGTKLRLRYALLGSIGLFLVAASIYLSKDTLGVTGGLIITAVLFPLYYGLDTVTSFLHGKEHFRTFSAICCVLALLPTLATIAVTLLGSRLEGIIATQLGMTALLNVIFLRAISTRLVRNSDIDEGALDYGKRVSGISLVGTIHANLNSLIVGTFFGFVDLALFSIGEIFYKGLKQLIYVLTLQAFPKLAAKSDEDAVRTVIRSLKYTWAVFILACTAIIFALPRLIPLLFTVKYTESILYAQLLVVGVLLSFPGAQFVTYFASHKKMAQQYKVQLSFALVEVGAILVLVWFFGVLGIIFARIISRAWYSGYSWHLATQLLRDDQVTVESASM